ncbi:MAG: IS4 family transposase [Myxococcaceae bacterium]|nr:IS4 family transposase [Myxococcaceae bacterium]
MPLDQDLGDVSAFLEGLSLDGLKAHVKPEWIEDALTWAGTTTIRKRRLPADQVVWLVIAMALFRNKPIERVVDELELALPDRKDTLVAKSAIAQARQRLSHQPLGHLFETTALEWSARSVDEHRWRGLRLYGMDGTTLRVPDSPENREEFGGQHAGGGRGDSGYPQVRVVALMAVRSHILAAFRFGPYASGETTLARDVWDEVPADSLVLVDRGYLVKKDLYNLERSRNRHWLTRSKVNTRWSIIETLGKGDYLAELELHGANLPSSWPIRVIHYNWKGRGQQTLLTSLTDAEKYPAAELVELYHERWETELAYDEVKTHLLERQESIRSRTPDGVRQELWGIALAYNLVRLEMERLAAAVKVAPTRISFTGALALVRTAFSWLGDRRLAYGTIPKSLARVRADMKRLLLPERRRERQFPRAVKVKMSNYPRKRPVERPAK